MKLYQYLLACLAFATTAHAARVALCVVATGKYDVFADEMIQSAREHFCKGHEVQYFVFTDGAIARADDVTVVHQKRLGWPYDTLMRFAIYLKHQELFADFDYIYATDADMRFVATVAGEKIFSDLVGTLHPGYITQRGTYETNPVSTACVKHNEGKHYFAGGFYGGKRDNVFAMLETVVGQIETDLKRGGFIAVWHDESHLNRYFIDNPPTKILSPAYCCPENTNVPWYDDSIKKIKKRLIALDKDHAKLRK